MKRDLYLKGILTIIAVLLAVIALRPVKVVPDAKAIDAVNCTGTLRGRSNDVKPQKTGDGPLTTTKDFDVFINCR